MTAKPHPLLSAGISCHKVAEHVIKNVAIFRKSKLRNYEVAKLSVLQKDMIQKSSTSTKTRTGDQLGPSTHDQKLTVTTGEV